MAVVGRRRIQRRVPVNVAGSAVIRRLAVAGIKALVRTTEAGVITRHSDALFGRRISRVNRLPRIGRGDLPVLRKRAATKHRRHAGRQDQRNAAPEQPSKRTLWHFFPNLHEKKGPGIGPSPVNIGPTRITRFSRIKANRRRPADCRERIGDANSPASPGAAVSFTQVSSPRFPVQSLNKSSIFLVFLRLKKKKTTTEKSPLPATPLDSCRIIDTGTVLRCRPGSLERTPLAFQSSGSAHPL